MQFQDFNGSALALQSHTHTHTHSHSRNATELRRTIPDTVIAHKVILINSVDINLKFSNPNSFFFNLQEKYSFKVYFLYQ